MESNPRQIRSLFLTMMAAGLLCRLAYVFLTPTFQAPDEEEHFNYIHQLVANRAFPVMNGMGGDAARDWEYEQPPLYYLLTAPVLGVTQAAGMSLDATVRVLRLGSVLLWGVNLWLGIVLLRRLPVRNGFVEVFVVGMTCLLPTYTFVSSAINNDNLLITLAAAILCLLAAQTASIKNTLWLGILLGLALLTKKSAMVFLPAVALLPLLDAWRKRAGWTPALVRAVVPVALALVIFIPWAWRDWHVYGSLNPEELASARKAWPSPIYGIGSAIHNLVKTFWAASGITNNVSYPFPLAGECLLVLACAPGAWWRSGQSQNVESDIEAVRRMQAIFILVSGIAIVLVLRFGYLLGMGQGRHLFPVLYPIAWLLALRLRRLPVKNRELVTAGFWVVYAISFMAFSLVRLR